MSKSAGSFIKGMGAGMVAGTIVCVAGKMAMSNKQTKKTITKGTSRALHAVGDFVEGIQSLMK